MIAQRLRGLVNLHVAASATLAAMLLLTMGNVVRYQSFIDLSRDINLTPYLLCVLGAMAISGRSMAHYAARYHRLGWVDAAQLATRQVALTALVIFAFMFAFKDRAMSRIFMGTYLMLCWGMMLFVNLGLPRMLSRLFFERGRIAPTLFVGSRRSLDRLRNWMEAKEMLGLHAVGFLTIESEKPEEIGSLPYLGGISELPLWIQQTGALQIVVLEIPQSHKDGRFIIEACQNGGCRLLIYSNLADILRHPLVTVSEEGHLFYTLQNEPLEDPINRIAKRLFDIAVSLPVVVILLPPLSVFVWVSQLIQSPGPLIFAQQRTGQNGRKFRMLKFRSMNRAVGSPSDEARQARRGDERIYPFGRFLRRSSLDEVPQFINSLIGDMSVVGPRPHLPAHDTQFAEMMHTYRTRFYVKPGITGLAQCNGFRGEITEPTRLQRRVEYDISYVSNWSFWLDVQITLRTVRAVLFPPKTAY